MDPKESEINSLIDLSRSSETPQENLPAVNPLDMPIGEFRSGLARRGENRKALIEWVRSALVDGVDFGSITFKGRASKPTLRKPGAEKICGMLGVTAVFPTLERYEEAALKGVAVNQIILRCHLQLIDGRVVADGIGARSLDQDGGDMNKALKMAAKSAMIDATLRMAGLSEIFTQDLEDMPPKSDEDGIPSGPEFIQSGKHKGKKWEEVSGDYLQAIVSGDKASKEFKAACQAEINRRASVMQGGGIDEGDRIPFA
jgi:hypothetical protein